MSVIGSRPDVAHDAPTSRGSADPLPGWPVLIILWGFPAMWVLGITVIPGAIVPQPYGGMPKQLLVSLDQQQLLAHNLTATDVHEAFGRQNIVLPAGDQKIKTTDWMVLTNSTPLEVEDFNSLPIKRVGNTLDTE